MRLLCAFVLASSLWALPLALGGDGAAAVAQFNRAPSVSERQLVLEAKILCGMFDGKFGCQQAPGVVEYGKTAIPGTNRDSGQFTRRHNGRARHDRPGRRHEWRR